MLGQRKIKSNSVCSAGLFHKMSVSTIKYSNGSYFLEIEKLNATWKQRATTQYFLADVCGLVYRSCGHGDLLFISTLMDYTVT